jgi:alpha-beta hydrolase superfamily lysophospholipase
MKSIIFLLTHSGIDVLNLSLRGHGSNYSHDTNKDTGKSRLEAFKTVTYKLWIDETHQAYLCARERSEKENVPLFLLGYSLGGLLGADLFTSYSDVYFDKMILLAPAFDLYGISCVIKLLSPFPRLVIPSFSTRSYLSNYGTPMSAYNALFDSIKHFKENINPKINVPTIIFIDKRDELISLHGLKDMLEVINLYQWRFHFLQKGEIGVEVNMNHLIIDEASVGKDTWHEMINVMINHLLL